MKKLLFLLFLLSPTLHAEGPLFKFQDPAQQQEFENVYKDLRNKLASPLSTSTGTITSFTSSTATITNIVASTANISGYLNVGGALVVNTAGEVLQPLQPCFSVYLSANISNLTGSTNSDRTISFDSETIDVGNDFAASTFTASVPGTYQFQAIVRTSDLTAAMTRHIVKIRTSNRGYELDQTITPTAGGGEAYTITSLADMDANDTAYVTINIINGAGDTADIVGAGATTYRTYFTGTLIN